MKIYLAGAIAKMGAKQKTSLGTIAQTLRNKGLEVFSPISCVKGVRGLRRYDFKKLHQNAFTTILG